MKVIKSTYHIKIVTPNGAGYSLPIEVIKGIMDGEIESKYESACEFLNNEDKNAHLEVNDIKKAYEGNV